MFWQIIAANKRKTVLLILLMGAILAALGFFVGESIAQWSVYSAFEMAREAEQIEPAYQVGMIGLGVALIIWLVLLLVSLFGSDQLFLSMAGAREITREMYPQLYNVVEEMKIAGSLPKIPKIYIVDDPAPNAFALGKSPEKSMVCVTAGLLAMCNRDELQGVVAHEISHILNRDILYLTVAATMLGAITFIADAFWRTLRYAPAGRYRSSRSGKGRGAALWIMLIALFFLILSPILSRILYFSISRRREYLADATSARLTRYPEGLASALEKIMRAPAKLSTAPAATAPFYIVNPYKQDLSGGMFATHPPLEQRITILRSMTMGAGFADYVKAYWTITHTHKPLIPAADLQLGEKVEVRQPSSAGTTVTPSAAVKKAGDIIRAMNNFAFINCACGMKLKVPPEFTKREINCPRCNRLHKIPASDQNTIAATLAASAALSQPERNEPSQEVPAGMTKPSQPQVEKRNPGAWQNFVCQLCGNAIQISPAFGLKEVKCSKCNQRIVFE
jgi:heat shock protein HtpX